MKYRLKILLGIFLLAGGLLLLSCQQSGPQTGVLEGKVTIGPIWPVERPGESRPVPPEVFAARKVMVYDASGKKLVKEVSIQQIDQTATGYYSVQLAAGSYTVDTNRLGIDRSGNLPQKITVAAGGTVTIDLDIDTGIR